MRSDSSGEMPVLEAGSCDLVGTYPDELVYDAVVKMLENDVGRLPVVKRQDPHHLVGYLGRASVLTALLRQIEQENRREPGWLTRSTVRGLKRKGQTKKGPVKNLPGSGQKKAWPEDMAS